VLSAGLAVVVRLLRQQGRGHIGAAFLYEVIHALEAPELLLMEGRQL